jgi:hypothetical protein
MQAIRSSWGALPGAAQVQRMLTRPSLSTTSVATPMAAASAFFNADCVLGLLTVR